ncbi:unnamed protein product, partial [Laminaria digitata]
MLCCLVVCERWARSCSSRPPRTSLSFGRSTTPRARSRLSTSTSPEASSRLSGETNLNPFTAGLLPFPGQIVVRLVIYVEGEDEDHIEPHLVFQMYCEFGYRKVHRFSLQDCEIMHAVFDGEGSSRLSCPPVQLSQLLEHIHGTAEVAV